MNRQTESTAVEASQPSTVGTGPMPRRSALKAFGLAGGALGSGLGLPSMASAQGTQQNNGIPAGDAAILRFLAAAELLEADLWLQYQELAVANQPYADALSQLDEDMAQYVLDNTDDEMSHAAFLNAYLTSVGAQPVNLDAF